MPGWKNREEQSTYGKNERQKIAEPKITESKKHENEENNG